MSTVIELGEALAGLREQLAKDGIDALVAGSAVVRRHLSSAAGAAPTVGDPLIVVTVAGTLATVDVDGPEPAGAAIAAALAAAGARTVGVDPALPGPLHAELVGCVGGERLRGTGDLLFAELANRSAAERAELVAAANLADIGYTAVMDHLYVGMPLLELADFLTRSTRRAGGGFGWAVDAAGWSTGTDEPVAGSNLVSVRGFDAGHRLQPDVPVRYGLHPLLRGTAGYAATTALLSKADPQLRALGERTADAVHAMVAAIRPGELLRAAYPAFREHVREHVPDGPARQRMFTLAGGGIGAVLAPDAGVLAEPGTIVGICGAAGDGQGRAVEFGGVVVVSDAGAELITSTPVRLVELY